MKTLDHGKQLSPQALKERYLRCFGERTNNAALLQSVVRDLIHEGIPRQTLAAWAVEAGYSKGYVASLLCRVLVSLGLRERNKGAGRKPTLAALELLAHARSRYGKHFLRVLYAACRAGKVHLAAANTSNGTSQSPVKPNCTSTIRRGTRPTGRSNGERYRSATMTFNGTFKPVARISSKNRGTL